MNLIIHLIAGIALAGIISLIFKRLRSKQDFLSMSLWFSLANLIDLDHLFANPIYDPLRCGINFHPLHSWFMFPFYMAALFHKKTRYLSVGILSHLLLDGIDCTI